MFDDNIYSGGGCASEEDVIHIYKKGNHISWGSVDEKTGVILRLSKTKV